MIGFSPIILLKSYNFYNLNLFTFSSSVLLHSIISGTLVRRPACRCADPGAAEIAPTLFQSQVLKHLISV